MSNRRNFIKHLTAAGIANSIPRAFFIPFTSAIPSLNPKEFPSEWLELVSPTSLGMDPDMLRQVDALIEQTIAIGHTPGAVVAIGRGNKMGLLKGYGNRQLYPEKEKITLDTIFDLASVTKVAAAATAMAVVIDQGKVSPDDLVIKYFPEFKTKGKNKITLRHLFTHTSGIGSYSKDVIGTKEYLFKVLCSLDLVFPIGERFDYNDNNVLMLGHIVEKVSGKTLDEFTLEHIYKPLGMLDTMYNPDVTRIERTAATEMRDGIWYKGIVNDFNTYNLGGVAGDTGLFSTAPDLAILSALWLGKGTLVKKDGSIVKLFKEKTYQKLAESQFLNVGIRGLLWDKRSGSKNRPWNMSPDAMGHGGWTGTSIWIDPKLDLFVVVLGNRRHPFGKTPNIYPTAARVGVVAVNSIVRKNETLALYYSQEVKFSTRRQTIPVSLDYLKKSKIGLIVSREEIEDPNGLPAQLKKKGIEIAALYFPDESAIESDSEAAQYTQLVPVSVKTNAHTGVPVYALTRDCSQILPPMLHGIKTILFGLKVPKNCPEDLFWFITNILGSTLQSASDYRLKYAIADFPNPLKNKFIDAKDLKDKLKPFGVYSRQARQFGLTFCDIAAKISEEQFLELEIGSISAVELQNN
ncbi:MAG TPA: serine hydrolase [Flavitalea sp.]|nr:serine hydrolase [Flavitalea sp.]